jgi:hypothetical protein
VEANGVGIQDEHFIPSLNRWVNRKGQLGDPTCRNPSFGLTTKAKGVARLRAKRKEALESRRRHCKSASQEEARELRQKEARKSHHILLRVLESVRE